MTPFDSPSARSGQAFDSPSARSGQPPSLRLAAARVRLQRGGAFLSGMILPNIAAFLGWGLITALFTPAGWLPNPRLAALVSPLLLTLLPILIGFSGGRLVYGLRGGVVGALATVGAIASSDVPMLLAAMGLGPLGGWVIRRLDERMTAVPAALQMLAANFSAAIAGTLLAIAALVAIGPAVTTATNALGRAAQSLTSAALLPLIALVIEPAKVLFLNNAINHGILAPLGAAEAHSTGRSIFFLLESNPGPGLGLLAAVWVAGGAAARHSAPGAMLVHFVGGIHEIYFPYVLMQPLTVLALVAGGLAANVVFVFTGAGLVATPSPGSIFAELAMAPRGGALPVIFGIAAGACCSFAAAVPLVRRAAAGATAADLFEARDRSRALDTAARPAADSTIVFACDAGMGSSVIGAAMLQRKLRDAGITVRVMHSAIAELPSDATLIVVHESLAERARAAAPRAAVHVVNEFIHSPVYDRIVESLRPATMSRVS